MIQPQSGCVDANSENQTDCIGNETDVQQVSAVETRKTRRNESEEEIIAVDLVRKSSRSLDTAERQHIFGLFEGQVLGGRTQKRSVTFAAAHGSAIEGEGNSKLEFVRDGKPTRAHS